jgi:tellurium resistance protein TerZ
MSVSSNKKTGINLSKGNSISLVKDEKLLEKICIGLNWGTIKKKSFLGLLKTTEPVDLDGSVTTFSKENKNLYTVYYQNLSSPDGAIKHSGDDREGDDSVDDLDNEVITIDLKKLN